jgi:lantibiotic modifying enzyme
MTPEDSAGISDCLSAWTNAFGSANAGALERRLFWDDAKPETADAHFRSLLRRPDPDSFSTIARWLTSSKPIDTDDPPDDLQLPFAHLWRLIVPPAMQELARRLPDADAVFRQSHEERWGGFSTLYRDIGDDFVARLSAISEPALWKEFNLRRTPSQIVMAHLRAVENGTGALSRALYSGFLESLRGDGARALTAKYPALARHLSTTLDQWLDYHCELLTRVHHDRAALIERFRMPADALLCSIAPNLSDPHRGGRTVARLSFRSESDPAQEHPLAYKPKDVRLDHAFQRLLTELPPPTPADRPLASLVVLSRSGYGYMEWAYRQVCQDGGELGLFYRNAGRLAAILHLLGGTDCHH